MYIRDPERAELLVMKTSKHDEPCSDAVHALIEEGGPIIERLRCICTEPKPFEFFQNTPEREAAIEAAIQRYGLLVNGGQQPE